MTLTALAEAIRRGELSPREAVQAALERIERATSPCRRQYLLAPMKLSNERRNVRYWHKADIPSCTAHVRFWG